MPKSFTLSVRNTDKFVYTTSQKHNKTKQRPVKTDDKQTFKNSEKHK